MFTDVKTAPIHTGNDRGIHGHAHGRRSAGTLAVIIALVVMAVALFTGADGRRKNLERVFGEAHATDAQQQAQPAAAETDIARLARLLPVATPAQFALLYPIVAAGSTPAVIEQLARIAATPPPPALRSVERIAFGQRRAGAAVTLLRLGEREKILPLFEVTDDPEALTQFIFRCRARAVGVDALLDVLSRLSDGPPSRLTRDARYALLLTLGEFTLAEVPESRRDALLKQLAGWYRHDPSSAVHGAAGWLLRQWGNADVVRLVDQTPIPYSPGREWFTLSVTVKSATAGEPRKPQSAESKPAEPVQTQKFSYTFIVFPAGDYTIGSVQDEPGRNTDEIRHAIRLTRPFALLDREIPLDELIAFNPPRFARFIQQPDGIPEESRDRADWYDAVSFCRWLGQQMGLPESDQPYANPASLDKNRYPQDPNPRARPAPHNWPLEPGRRGFRLPSEVEWESASRAGARTAYSFGGDISLLGRFAWFDKNSGLRAHALRELRPDRSGLFDAHGNLFEWTHDWYGPYDPKARADPPGPSNGSFRVYRGGGYANDAAGCRSANRNPDNPTFRPPISGFRLALTLPVGVPDARKGK